MNVVTRLAHVRDQRVDLLLVARLALDFGDQALGRQLGEDPLVIDLDDVDVVPFEQGDDLVQRARLILQRDPQPREPPLPRQIAQQHGGEQA